MLCALEQSLLLLRLPGVGAATYWKLVERFSSPNAVLSAPLESLADLLTPEAIQQLREFRERGEESALVDKVRADIKWADQHNVVVMDTDHPNYPELLREIKRPPPILYVAGDVNRLSMPQIAVIGSRSPSPSGRSSAYDFSAALASAGFTITSGLALGVDTEAHKGALSVRGYTIAVLGTGLDVLYPQRNKSLADQILHNGGAIVSEFPLGTSAQPANFPQRNRIISALCYGTLVVEAAVRSGSLITARYAVQQNRELFAIPGSIHNPLARGCHALIKDGAKLVETAQDIVDELKGFLSMQWQQLSFDRIPDTSAVAAEIVGNEEEDRVLQALGYEATSIDNLVDRTELPVGEVMACLLTLELKGLVANVGTGYMRIKQSNVQGYRVV
ncbi:DNA-processing protein DprA [Teredinibacter waterburyi]|jgi:DNA protecting protein DprA|uniref:DNA-processing protein DprA n=1 Tax=Teredinibacter waterburyi TaxID=1500538 RepID=UPI00165F0F89|nr:DNA-processing protein DprA [Teredinibacter waterburyi]